MEVESGKDFQTIVIEKPYDQIEKDLKSILLFENPIKANEIQAQWTNYLELTVQPVGWKAVWKLSRNVCLEFGVEFPVLAVVKVDNVHFDVLTADVTVICVEEDVAGTIPDRVDDIPLIQLYPTIDQETYYLDFSQTAEALESLRLFYRHLWYPWDIEDDSCTWVQDHLENRLKLHFDITFRKIPRYILSKINNFIETGNDVFKKIQEQSASIQNDDSDENDVILAQLCVEMNYIKENLNLLEIKHMRDTIDSPEKHIRNMIDSPQKVDEKLKVFLIWLDALSDDLLSVLTRIKSQLPDDKNSFSCVPSLNKVLNECWIPKFIVYVGEGNHILKGSCELSSEGSIQGVGAASKTLIESSEGCCLLFNVLTRGINFSNVTLVGSRVKCVIVVRFGRCEMSNVTVKGSHKNVAVLVESGAEFYADSCTFSDCSVAIEANKGSKITLKNCVIQNNLNGFVFQSSQVHLENCHFIENTNSAVVQVSGDTETIHVSNGNSGIMLDSLQGVTAKGISFTDNKCNVTKKFNHPAASSDEVGEM